MTTFAYKGFDASGKVCKGLTEASDIKNAREKLAGNGILAESLTPAGQNEHIWISWRKHVLSSFERTRFYEELLILLRAGLPIVKALDMMIQSPEAGKTSLLLAAIRDKINEGASLANALSDSGANISAYEKGIIAAGERAGALDTALERLSRFLNEQNRLRDSVITALIYPALIIIIALFIAVGLLGFAVPRIGSMLQEESGLSLPLLTRCMIGVGNFTAKWGIPLCVALGAGIWIGWRHIRRDPALRAKLNKLIFRIPVIGHGYTLLVNLRFARTLSLLLTEDVPLIEAMTISAEATGSEWTQEMFHKEANQVRHGSALADALRRMPPFAPHLARWAEVGEASGRLPQILESAGIRFQQQWDGFVTRLMTILEPALIIAISGFVLIIVLSIILPVMSLSLSLR